MASITCQICGREFRLLNRHMAVHKIPLSEYRERYPAAPVMVEGLLERMKDALRFIRSQKFWSSGNYIRKKTPA